MLRSFEGSGGSSSELLLAPFAFPHLVHGVPDVLLQPFDLRVQTHLFVGPQLGDHLEGAAWGLDEPELSNVAFRNIIDGYTAVASLHQADRFCF